MIVAFDSSVLVAASLDRHPLHAQARVWLRAAFSHRVTGMIVAHARAEVFATVTAIPGLRVAPAVAAQIVADITRGFTVVPCDDGLYLAALERCTMLGLSSGAVYDALHFVGAEWAGAAQLLTFDADDFRRFQGSAGPQVVVPSPGDAP